MPFSDKFPFNIPESGPRGRPPGGGLPKVNVPWKLVVGGVTLVLVALVAYSSVYTVQPEERGVVTRFGAVHGISDPGLHTKLPFGIDRVQLVPTERVLKQEFGFSTVADGRPPPGSPLYEEESLMLTGDLNIIKVEWVVQYRIGDPVKWLYQIRDPERTLRDVSEAVMRRIVGNRLGSDVLTIGRVEISLQAKEEIQEIMDSFDAGVLVSTVELQDVLPTTRVQPAFNEVNIARQERERMINEAEKRRNQVIPRVRGQANQLIAEAEGYAAERVNRAHGEVNRFQAMLAEYQQAPEVTRRRLYLEMIDRVLPQAGQVLVVQSDQQTPLPVLDLKAKAAAHHATTKEVTE